MIQEIWFGDCLELMKNIPDKSVDMILCDLPYGTTACKWDVVINFRELWGAYERILKDNCIVLLFGSEPFSTIQRMSNFNWFKYDWYWEKTKANGWQHSKNKPMTKIETISVFSPNPIGHFSILGSKRMKYNPQDLISIGKKVVKSYWHGESIGSRKNQIGKEYESFTGFPSNILKYANIHGGGNLHPTQKPVELCEYLIKTYTNEGDLILDNCAGSGSTLVAAKNLNRQFIGIEKDEGYYNICLERLK
jgi:site-specific DNA-methyltransferase (adenine-specific)